MTWVEPYDWSGASYPAVDEDEYEDAVLEYPPEKESEDMVKLQKMNIVGVVPVLSKPGDDVIGRAKMEKTRSGDLIAHVDILPEHRHVMDIGGSGFKIGDFSIAEED